MQGLQDEERARAARFRAEKKQGMVVADKNKAQSFRPIDLL